MFPTPPLTEMTLLVAAALAVLAALYASASAVLATLAVLALVSIVLVVATYQEDPLGKLVTANEKASCGGGNDCAVNRCAIQTMDNPFANPGPAQFGTSNVFAGDCPLAKADALMKARERVGGVQYANGRAFYQVPSLDTADMRQWLYAMPENCKHDQRACRPDSTILDKARRDPITDGGSFVDYV